MEIDQIIQKFESRDKHQILDAVWLLLDCTDRDFMFELLPHLPQFHKKVKAVDLGGVFYQNSKHFDLAMAYVKHVCDGGCHCFIYKSTSLFNPIPQEKKGHLTILSTSDNIELYQVNFEVECSYCNKRFGVTEVHGGHVPWYQWCAA
ncbi:hypothetical protein [Litoribacillus peritrichatus]|uniref:Uncharacterized protein n=1 Tax=Litoribacillus peritrichatus TaxID=718191 RepID=A0ABP7MAB3_9GAMM